MRTLSSLFRDDAQDLGTLSGANELFVGDPLTTCGVKVSLPGSFEWVASLCRAKHRVAAVKAAAAGLKRPSHRCAGWSAVDTGLCCLATKDPEQALLAPERDELITREHHVSIGGWLHAVRSGWGRGPTLSSPWNSEGPWWGSGSIFWSRRSPRHGGLWSHHSPTAT